MGRNDWDRFMVHHAIGGNRKLRRLTPAERWCYVAGVLALASQSPERGVLLIAVNVPATADDYADAAGVPKATAVAALEKLRDLEMVAEDDQGREVVHDWDVYQPRRKPSDAPPATRARKQKQRDNEKCHARDNGATGGVTSRDVTRDPSREVRSRSTPPTPPRGEHPDFAGWLEDHEAVTGRSAPAAGTKAREALAKGYAARREEGYTDARLRLATRGAHADDYRRENGYDRAESVLRPTKVHDLAENGRARAVTAAAPQQETREQRIARINAEREEALREAREG